MIKKRNKNFPSIILLFLGGVILTIGDVIATQWIRFGGNYLYIIVLLFYLAGMIFLVKSYKTEDIPVASIILVIFNVIVLIFIGVFLFNEEINFLKILGIILCFISIFLLEFGKKISYGDGKD
jgi:multidrug transporter EmrE-like cation transporter